MSESLEEIMQDLADEDVEAQRDLAEESIACNLPILANGRVEQQRLEKDLAEMADNLSVKTYLKLKADLAAVKNQNEALAAALRSDARVARIEHPAIRYASKLVLHYKPEAALAWAQTNLPKAFVTSLDKSLFEKHAKAVQETAPLLFVEYAKEVDATLVADLSAYVIPQVPFPALEPIEVQPAEVDNEIPF